MKTDGEQSYPGNMVAALLAAGAVVAALMYVAPARAEAVLAAPPLRIAPHRIKSVTGRCNDECNLAVAVR